MQFCINIVKALNQIKNCQDKEDKEFYNRYGENLINSIKEINKKFQTDERLIKYVEKKPINLKHLEDELSRNSSINLEKKVNSNPVLYDIKKINLEEPSKDSKLLFRVEDKAKEMKIKDYLTNINEIQNKKLDDQLESFKKTLTEDRKKELLREIYKLAEENKGISRRIKEESFNIPKNFDYKKFNFESKDEFYAFISAFSIALQKELEEKKILYR